MKNLSEYVNVEEFYNEIVESQKNLMLTPKAIETLEFIANKTLNKLPPLVIDRDEVISFMLAEAQKQLKNFNPEHPAKPLSAFNFFHTVLKHFLMKKSYKNIFSCQEK